MPDTDTKLLVRMVLESLVGLLVGILSWNVAGIKTDVEGTVTATHAIAVTIEGIKTNIGTLTGNLERFDAIQRRNSEMIIELRSQVNPRRVQ